jgi:transcriptional regulator with XRE-family HTH domain
MKKLGKFMKEKREAMGLSLRDASKLSGVSHTHIRDIEDGRSIPSFEMVMKFLKAYMVDSNAEHLMPKQIFRITIIKVAGRGR